MAGRLPLQNTIWRRSRKRAWMPAGMAAFVGASLGRTRPAFHGVLATGILVLLAIPGLPGNPGSPGSASGAGRLTVAAASSLQHVFREVVLQYQEQGRFREQDGSRAQGGSRAPGGDVTLVFGASGSLAHQIENGAPYTLFASANEEWVTRLVKNGQALPGSLAVFGEGVLAMVVRDASLFPPATALPGAEEGGDLSLLRREQVRFVALANPKYAPYGMAAREALLQAGLWNTVKSKLVFGDNVRQALTYLETENADAAFVAASLLGRSRFSWRPVPASAHRPIRYTLCLIDRGRRTSPGEIQAGKRLVSFLLGQRGRAILARYGIRPPRETHEQEGARPPSVREGS